MECEEDSYSTAIIFTTVICIYTKYQIRTFQSMYKQPAWDTQNNVFSLHTFNRKVKNQHDLYSEQISQQADITHHSITTIVEQHTYDM
jgi:hypothetical protein